MAVDTEKRTRIVLTVSKDSMAASILVRNSDEGEPPITVDEIREELENGEVVFGIDEAVIERIVDDREYNTPINVATGRKPERGVSASFTFHFDISESRKPKEDESGHVDYRDISFIQNTSKGDKLVTKVPPTPGRPGMTVRGKELKGPSGRDKTFNNGVNTEVSGDGLYLLASADGAIQYQYGKVSIIDVIVIKGDVDHTVGNIDCQGSVRVTGGIKAGFEIKVDGDLEVNGNVEDANIDVGGNVFVKGGFFGNKAGTMKTAGNITLKFAEGQTMIAGNDINIGGEMINCHAQADNRIVVQGRHGRIVGGDIKAEKEIRAAFLGSEAGTSTHLSVAFDNDLMKRHIKVIRECQRIKDDGERVKEGLYALYRLQMNGTLTPEKQQVLEKLERFQKELPVNINALLNEKREIEEAMAQYKDALIIAEKAIYPGVRASFGIVYRDINEEQQRCKLTLEGNKVIMSEHREE